MLLKLENPHTIVFLGDLFKIWLAPQKYWNEIHHIVLNGVKKLREGGCNVVFIAGNREMLLPRKLDDRWKEILPLDSENMSHSNIRKKLSSASKFFKEPPEITDKS